MHEYLNRMGGDGADRQPQRGQRRRSDHRDRRIVVPDDRHAFGQADSTLDGAADQTGGHGVVSGENRGGIAGEQLIGNLISGLQRPARRLKDPRGNPHKRHLFAVGVKARVWQSVLRTALLMNDRDVASSKLE